MSNFLKRVRRRERRKQLRINTSLKKRLFKDVADAPCYYCKEQFSINNLTIEHIIPRCCGGTNEDSNITLACAPCNQREGQKVWFLKKQIMALRYKSFHDLQK